MSAKFNTLNHIAVIINADNASTKNIDGDLRYLCEKYGVELSNAEQQR